MNALHFMATYSSGPRGSVVETKPAPCCRHCGTENAQRVVSFNVKAWNWPNPARHEVTVCGAECEAGVVNEYEERDCEVEILSVTGGAS